MAYAYIKDETKKIADKISEENFGEKLSTIFHKAIMLYKQKLDSVR